MVLLTASKRLLKKGLLYLIVCMCSVLVTQAQNASTVVTGTVTDAKGAPVAGASVTVEGVGNGTTTDSLGRFSIKVANANGALTVSYVGMESQTIQLAGKSKLDVALKAAATDLNDVVVIGYGTVKKRNVVGSVASIGESQIKDRPIARLDQALAAQMPGVQVQAVSGTPGAASQIRVRGAASISGVSDPIYVVDGVIVDDLNNIDPNTIQSLDVLKDASSTAIYGARGSNGVVLITTKRGKKGKPKIDVISNFAVQRPEKTIKMLSPQEWIQFRKDITDSAWVNYGRTRGLNYSASDNMDFRASEYNRLNPTATPVANTHALANPAYMYDPLWQYGTDSLDYVDWQKSFYGEAGLMQKYGLAASGATDNSNYLLSGEFFSQDGMVKGTGYKRASFRANIESKLNDRVTAGLSIAPSISWQEGFALDGRGAAGLQPAGYAPIQEKGVGDMAGVKGTPWYRWNADVLSTLYMAQNILNKTELVRVYSNAFLNINFTKGLDLRTTFGWNTSSSDYKNYTPTAATSGATRRTAAEGSLSTAIRNTARTQYFVAQSVLTYNKTFGDHELNALAGISGETNSVANTNQRASKFPNDVLYTFDNVTSTVTLSNNSESKRKMYSFFGRVLYNYKGRYLASASMRYDGTSRFYYNLYGNFPALSLGWRISEESFMDFIKPVVNDLKLRYSWGVSGNDRISGSNDYPSFGLVGATTYSFNGAQVPGYSQTSINTPLKWERTTSNDWGFDVSLMHNRLNVSVDYFSKTTKDLLLAAPVLGTTGFSTEYKNIGKVSNKGLEVNVTSTNMRTKNFQWSTKVNFSTLKNRVLALSNDNTPILTGYDKTVEIAVGQPIFVYKLYDAIGVYTTQEKLATLPKMTSTIIGDPVYRDVNGSKTITSADMTNVGSPIPTYTWGLTNTFTYKNFDASILFQGQGGNKIFSMFGRNIDRPTSGLYNYNARGVWKNRFRSLSSPGDGVTPRIDASTAGLYDTRWLYDGAFWKVKNLTVGYNVKTKLKGISTLRIYASVENLWMHSNYDGGYSPEAFQSDAATLADYSSYPTARTFSLGLNLGL